MQSIIKLSLFMELVVLDIWKPNNGNCTWVNFMIWYSTIILISKSAKTGYVSSSNCRFFYRELALAVLHVCFGLPVVLVLLSFLNFQSQIGNIFLFLIGKFFLFLFGIFSSFLLEYFPFSLIGIVPSFLNGIFSFF